MPRDFHLVACLSPNSPYRVLKATIDRCVGFVHFRESNFKKKRIPPSERSV